MSIVSFAQNFEDVMLWRALKDVECGFYIDVGANDPVIDSITKAFYDNGWRGVNLEPVSYFYEALKRERLRDVNLQVAAGSSEGELNFYEIPESGLSTLNKEIADGHAEKLGFEVINRKVQVRTLTDICKQYHLAPIHFLKIDVEGAEQQVLEGIDFELVRPWIVVIESTLPTSQVETFLDWEALLLESNYNFVYFDGLNRFYVSQEHSELIDKLNVPPNVFDGFSLAGNANNPFTRIQSQQIADLSVRTDCQSKQLEVELNRAEQAEARAQEESERTEQAEARAQEESERAEQAEARAQEESEQSEQLRIQLGQLQTHLSSVNAELAHTQERLEESQQRVDQIWVQACAYEQQIIALHKSTSWRITAPLRLLRRLIAWLLALPFRAIKALILRPLLSMVILLVLKIPALHKRLGNCLRKYPNVFAHLRQYAISRGYVETPPTMLLPVPIEVPATTVVNVSEETESVLLETPNLDCLTPRAKQIFQDLVEAVEKSKDNH